MSDLNLELKFDMECVMYRRDAENSIKRYATLYPCVGITGPRQSGKSTLAQTLFPHLPYVLLENIGTRTIAQNDPQNFLKKYAGGAIFDEIQHVPELLSYLQGEVDANQTPGRFIITGSQNFALSQAISQSLAGRIGMITLLPLSLHELNPNSSSDELILKGGYPRLHVMNMQPHDFFPPYIQTYIERDVRQIKNIENLTTFERFLSLCAGRIGQVLNFSSLAQDCGISHVTAQQWLNVLQASYIVFTLSPYHNNFNKRLIKMPKLYFYDTGLACSLLGIEDTTQLDRHFARGHLFENLAVLELLKSRLNAGRRPHLFFWRDRTGHEVDVIAEWGASLKAIEIKSSSTFATAFLKGVEYFKEIAGGNTENFVIYAGAEEYAVRDMKIIPLKSIYNTFNAAT